MQLFLFWVLCVLALFAVTGIVLAALRWRFAVQRDRYNPEKNYISRVAIGALLAAFVAISPPVLEPLINLAIEFINGVADTSISPMEQDVGVGSIVIYIVLCSAVSFILWMSYKDRVELLKREAEHAAAEEEERQLQIRQPPEIPAESPHLHERIRELFEIRLARYELELRQPANNPNVLYGSYRDDFHTFVELIYCDDRKGVTVTSVEQQRSYELLTGEILPRLELDDPIVHCHHIVTDGSFEQLPADTPLVTQTETQHLDSLIDFSKYLRNHLVFDYENHKLFSAVTREEAKKTLSDTFVAPGFRIGDDEEASDEELVDYVDRWLAQSSDSMHLVLLGDYGMGKTSFLRHYAAQLARRVLEQRTVIRYPVFLSLTNTSPRHGGITEKIKAFVADSLGCDYRLFEKLVHRGRILFLLDSFDEMGYLGTHAQRFEQMDAIWQLATRRNKILISGRPSYFHKDYELRRALRIPRAGHELTHVGPHCQKLTLVELDDDRIEAYTSSYYPTECAAYIEWIFDNPSVRDLCRRPSMMHIIRELLPGLIQEHASPSPAALTASETMERYVEFWYERQEDKEVPSAFQKKSREKKELILAFFESLAEHFHTNQVLKADETEIRARIGAMLDERQLEGMDRRENREGFESELLSGYFIEIDDEEYRFAHKSFFEYFVAKRIVDLIRAGEITHPLVVGDWTSEILDFVYDEVKPDATAESTRPWLLSLPDKPANCEFDLAMYRAWVRGVSITFFERSDLREFFWLYPTMLLGAWCERPQSRVAFVAKAYQVGLTKGQFDVRSNMHHFYALHRLGKPPMIRSLDRMVIEDKILSFRLELTDIELRDISFQKCRFYRTRFSKVSFRHVRFDRCSLRDVTFHDCTFHDVIWKDTKGHVGFKIDGTGPKSVDASTAHNLATLIAELHDKRFGIEIRDDELIELCAHTPEQRDRLTAFRDKQTQRRGSKSA